MPVLDWLTYTIRYEITNERVALEFAFNNLPEQVREDIWSDLQFENIHLVNYQLGKGFHGYTQSLVFDNGVKVLYAPGLSFSENIRTAMGTHFIIPGSCLSSLVDPVDPIACKNLIAKLDGLRYDYRFNRVDIAYDTSEYHISLFADKINRGEYVTRSNVHAEVSLKNRGIDFETITIGARDGLAYYRIYDKAKQLKLNDTVWTRIEGEYKAEGAWTAINAFINGNIGAYFMGSFRFVEELNNRKCRSKTWEVYMKIIDNDQRMKISKLRKGNTEKWHEESCLPSLLAKEKVCPGYIESLINKCHPSERSIAKFERQKSEIKKVLEFGVDAKVKEVGEEKEFYDQLKLFA